MRLPGLDGRARIDAVMASLRQPSPISRGLRCLNRPSQWPGRGALSFVGGDVVVYRLEGQCRLVVRPSGTEPKLKGYVEVYEPVGPQDSSALRALAPRDGRDNEDLDQTMLEEA